MNDEELITRAIEYVRATGFCTMSLLQRHFRISYPRAARLMDELEALKVIGPRKENVVKRDVLHEAR